MDLDNLGLAFRRLFEVWMAGASKKSFVSFHFASNASEWLFYSSGDRRMDGTYDGCEGLCWLSVSVSPR